MNFTIDEYQSEGIGPNQLGMGLQDSHYTQDSSLAGTNDDEDDSSISRNQVAGAWNPAPRSNKPTMSLRKLTLAEAQTETSCLG